VVEKIIAELQEAYPKHPWLAQQKQMGDLFDHHADKYQL
jgi:hypothetical protein